MMNNSTVVAQLHRTLLDAMRRARPASLDRPVTVAEIYQDLVPYKTARTAIGFDMNADYEHTLLRLLAGEGDYARIEPREVRDKLRLELESPNPDVGMFREYADCDVWVSGDEMGPGAYQAGEADELWEDELVETEPPPDSEEIRAALEGELYEPVIEFEPEPEARAPQKRKPHPQRPRVPFEIAGETPEAPTCVFCGGDLPTGKMVNFCPFCGSDQSQQPCPSCGEMLEPMWRFCVSCGARVRAFGDHLN